MRRLTSRLSCPIEWTESLWRRPRRAFILKSNTSLLFLGRRLCGNWFRDGPYAAGLQVDRHGISHHDGTAVGRLERQSNRPSVGLHREIPEIDDWVDLQCVISDGNWCGRQMLRRSRCKSAATSNDVRSLLPVGQVPSEALVKVSVPGEQNVGPQAGRLAARIQILQDARGPAVFRVGRQRWVMNGHHNRALLRLAIRLQTCQFALQKIQLIVDDREMPALR